MSNTPINGVRPNGKKLIGLGPQVCVNNLGEA